MIRIDEIYNNTFWPWIQKNRQGTAMFFCDPPGTVSKDNLFNYGFDDIKETDFILLHDQEPIHLDLYDDFFKHIRFQATEYIHSNKFWRKYHGPVKLGHIVVSEKGQYANELKSRYGWKVHYYFFHGWACKDWFRGYDKTFLIPRAQHRNPTKTFISPNRIVAGKRDHRVIFLYHIQKNNLTNNWISAPRICPYESTDIVDVAKKYCNTLTDIVQVLDNADLPWLFPGEHTQTMSSCWLTNFEESADSLFYVPTETVYFGQRHHLTEKTFKAIALEMPFILVAPAGSLEYLRSYGFQTFGSVIDESYDEEKDDYVRLEKITALLKMLNNLSLKERQQIHRACLPMTQHNFEHFYGSNFENILWQEFLNMLNGF
jgi:hypothetical protein